MALIGVTVADVAASTVEFTERREDGGVMMRCIARVMRLTELLSGGIHQTYHNKLSDKGFSLSLWPCLQSFLALWLFFRRTIYSSQLVSIAFLYITQKPHKQA